jgi:DNA-binding XRE family transcriptional regulator
MLGYHAALSFRRGSRRSIFNAAWLAGSEVRKTNRLRADRWPIATLRAYRQEAGLSQEKLAAKVGLDRTYVGGAERGERNVALVNLVRFAEALGIEPGQLLSLPPKK